MNKEEITIQIQERQIGYKKEDVDNLIKHSSNLEHLKKINDSEIKKLKEDNRMVKLTAAKEIEAAHGTIRQLAKMTHTEKAAPIILKEERDKLESNIRENSEEEL